MDFLPLWIATFCYVWSAGKFVLLQDFAMATVYGAYALANVGLIIVAYRSV